MKKALATMLAVLMLLSLAACGNQSGKPQNTPADNPAATTPETSNPETSTPETTDPVQNTTDEVGRAVDGTLAIKRSDVAVLIHGTAVPMPYRFRDLVSAGVPADESLQDVELGAGDFYSLNLYLDENMDYVLIPAYYNETDGTVTVAEAGAGEITLTTYADEPQDQDISILGIRLGMAKSDVLALLGAPSADYGDSLEWMVEVSDADYIGSLSMYFTSEADDACVSQVTLSVREV